MKTEATNSLSILIHLSLDLGGRHRGMLLTGNILFMSYLETVYTVVGTKNKHTNFIVIRRCRGAF